MLWYYDTCYHIGGRSGRRSTKTRPSTTSVFSFPLMRRVLISTAVYSVQDEPEII